MPPRGYEPFLEMILENPSDDGPRMVYSDWLEERGDPRGEFIRLQLETARLPHDDAARDRLIDRESNLYREHYDIWETELPDWARQKYEYRRGFVTEVTVFTAWQRHFGDEISVSAPVEKVALQRAADQLSAFTEGSPARHMSELVILDDRVAPDDVRVLCRSESTMSSLRGLQFMGMKLLDSGALMLSLCPHLSRLHRLVLRRCSLTHRAVNVLSDDTKSNLRALTWLDLSENELGNDALWSLISSPMLERIERLCWNDNGLTNVSARMLAETADAPRLRHLELAGNHIGDAGARALIQRYPDLEFLDLSRNSMTPGMVFAVKQHYGSRVQVTISG